MSKTTKTKSFFERQRINLLKIAKEKKVPSTLLIKKKGTDKLSIDNVNDLISISKKYSTFKEYMKKLDNYVNIDNTDILQDNKTLLYAYTRIEVSSFNATYINEIINEIKNYGITTILSTIKESNKNKPILFKRSLDSLSLSIESTLKKESLELEQIHMMNEILEMKNEIDAFDFITTEVTYSVPLEDVYNDGSEIQLFDQIICDEFMPYIVYNEPVKISEGKDSDIKFGIGERKFKIHTSKNLAKLSAKSWTEKSKIPGTIFIKFYIGDEELLYSEDKNIPNIDYSEAIYYFSSNELEINFLPSRSIDIQDLIDKILDRFTGIRFSDNIKQKKVKGYYVVDNLLVNKYFFSDFVSRDEYMNKLFYIDEYGKPFSMKERLTIHMGTEYKSTNVSITMSNGKLQSNIMLIRNGRREYMNKSKDYLQIKISKSKSETISLLTMEILNRFLTIYATEWGKGENEAILDWYDLYMGDFLQSYQLDELDVKKTVERKFDEKMNKLNRLKSVLPEIFSQEGSSRNLVTVKTRPLVINNEDIPKYEKMKIRLKNGKRIPVQMMWYPPFTDNPQFMIVADEADHPYLGLDPNPYDSKDIYPYVPKTYTSSGKLEIDENHYVVNILRDKSTSASSNILTSDIIISPDGLGTVGGKIKDILLTDNLFRVGMVSSKSSLLHCIIYSLVEDEYLDMTKEEREDYILEERKRIYDHLLDEDTDLFAEVSKQELYDYYVDDIIEMIGDPDVFLDPALFYRILEEYYDINIFTFTNSKLKDESFLEIPRNKYFHDRPLKNNGRRNVIIYKHSKIILSRQSFPQCELIVEDTGYERYTIFEDKQILSNFNNIIQQMTSTKVFDMEKKEYSNSYSNNFRYEDFFKVKGLYYDSQIIDLYGKMRCLNLGYKDKEYSIFGNLSYPLNIPEYDEPFYAEYEDAISFITDVLGTKFKVSNIRITVNDTKMINGIWFNISNKKSDNYEDMYITLNPVLFLGDNDKILESYSIEHKRVYSGYQEETYSISQKIHIYSKVVNIMIQVCKLLLIKYGKSSRKFVNRYMIVDPSKTYTLDNIKRKINIKKENPTFRDYFRYFSRYSFVEKVDEDYKIVVDSEKAKESISYMLSDFYKDIKNKNNIPNYFENFYISEEDFTKNESCKIFINENSYIQWINMVNNNLDKIYEGSLPNDIIMSRDPITYKIGDLFFILQNVIDFNEKRAMNVLYEWKVNKKNIGYEASRISKDNIPNYISTANITDNNEIEIDDLESDYILLQYRFNNENRYAALLAL